MQDVIYLDELSLVAEAPVEAAIAPRRTLWGVVRSVARGVGSATEWLFGVASLILGLSFLAALPILQFLSLGYLLEASGRVARTGRLRDGLIGVRRAARAGGMMAGMWLSLWPAWFVQSYAGSAELIDPGGPVARGWRAATVAVIVLSLLHIFVACARGGRLRHFLWPFGNPFWLIGRLRRGGLYAEARDGLWTFAASLHLPHYFRVGLVGFLGTIAWIIPPAILIAAGGKAPVLGVLGVIVLAVIVPFLPFLQVHYAVEGRVSAMFSRRAVRDHFRRAPWAFAFALMVMLLAAIPLYLLKLEMISRDAAWLPSLVFVIFLAPARLLTGWAYARSLRRERPRHWLFRVLGRLAIIPVAVLYVMVVFFSQYTSWAGVGSLYEQHAFLLPVPFLDM
ncbi:MAG: hypothetical protein JWN86_3915 [Planctomycetota bacterium]|nr:hypothetical protein [Planctomycetota bacterium]